MTTTPTMALSMFALAATLPGAAPTARAVDEPMQTGGDYVLASVGSGVILQVVLAP